MRLAAVPAMSTFSSCKDACLQRCKSYLYVRKAALAVDFFMLGVRLYLDALPSETLAPAFFFKSDAGFAQHVLYLSATPIPRSLTLAMYGDMEVSLFLGHQGTGAML